MAKLQRRKTYKNLSKTGYPGVYRKRTGTKKFYFQTTLPSSSENLKNKRVSKCGFSTALEAYKAKIEIEEQAKHEYEFANKNKRLAYLIYEYKIHKKGTIKLSTYHSLDLLLNKYLYKKYGEYTITEFATIKNLDEFRNKIESSQNLGTTQKNKILYIVKDLYLYGNLVGLVSSDVCNRVVLKSQRIQKTAAEMQKRNRDNFWTIEQWHKFLNSIDEKDKWHLFFAVLGNLGCRIGEFRALQNKHVLIDKCAIRIEQQVLCNFGLGKSIITSPKTANSIRTVKISKKLMDQLVIYMKVLNCKDPNYFLFFNRKEPIGLQTIRRKFNEQIEKVGLPRITLHGIRHSNCTWLLSQNLSTQDIGKVSERLGHSSTKMTLDIYMGIHKEESIIISKTLDEIS